MQNIIIAEGETGIAIFFCGVCGKEFRAKMGQVTTANEQVICLQCIEEANSKRTEMGLSPIPFYRGAYLS